MNIDLLTTNQTLIHLGQLFLLILALNKRNKQNILILIVMKARQSIKNNEYSVSMNKAFFD